MFHNLKKSIIFPVEKYRIPVIIFSYMLLKIIYCELHLYFSSQYKQAQMGFFLSKHPYVDAFYSKMFNIHGIECGDGGSHYL